MLLVSDDDADDDCYCYVSGKLQGLRVAIRMLESMKKPELAQELEKKCKRGNNQNWFSLTTPDLGSITCVFVISNQAFLLLLYSTFQT